MEQSVPSGVLHHGAETSSPEFCQVREEKKNTHGHDGRSHAD